MKVRAVTIHKLTPENAWEQRILLQLGFPQVKKMFRRPQFLVKDTDMRKLVSILAQKRGIVPTKEIVEEFKKNGKLTSV